MPHLYNLFYEASQTGIPVLRPLMLEYPEDPNTFELADQFLVGDSILVAPVYRPDTQMRLVYLPAGMWVNYWTNERVEGGQYVTVPTPLETMPIFIKAGSFIAEGPIEQYAGEKQGADLTIHLYPLEGVSEYVYYEDDGRTFDYEQGTYNRLKLSCKQESGELEISYTYEHKSYESGRKNLIFFIHSPRRPEDVVSDERVEWSYDEQKQVIQLIVPDQYVEWDMKIKY